MSAGLPLHQSGVAALAAQLAAGTASSVAATEACLAQAAATAELNAYIHLDAAGALVQAAEADARHRARMARGPLDGVPVAVKDNLVTVGMPTTCGSKILAGYMSPYDATVVRRLRAAGAVLLGKLNMDEFAMGSTTETSASGPSRNPWDRSRVPGGSSGGSAAAVAAGSAFAALGSDTGGSVRQPAAFCGIVGLKPTYGRLSRHGLVAYASSLDVVGPMARSVADVALLMQALAGPDALDATAAEAPVPNFSAHLQEGMGGLRLGVVRGSVGPGVEPEVGAAVEAAMAACERLGAKLVEVDLPHAQHAIATYYVIAPAEASSNLERFDGVRYGLRRGAEGGLKEMYVESRAAGLGREVKLRILLGTFVLSSGFHDAYYVKAQRARTLVAGDFSDAFKKVDALITPTAPTVAFALGQQNHDPMKRYLADVFTVAANLAGLPALSLPCGFSAAGLPVGLQLIVPAWQEPLALRLGAALEAHLGLLERRPPC